MYVGVGVGVFLLLYLLQMGEMLIKGVGVHGFFEVRQV